MEELYDKVIDACFLLCLLFATFILGGLAMGVAYAFLYSLGA